MPALSVVCSACKSGLTVAEGFAPKMAGKTIVCPVCESPLTLPSAPAAATPPPTAAKPPVPGKPVRLTCPQCSAQFTLSYDTASKMAGSAMKCLKCDAEIPVPSLDAPTAEAAPESAPSPDAAAAAPHSPTPTPATPPPTRRKCTGCLSPIEPDITFCPICGTRADDRKTTLPTGGATRLKVRKEAEPAPPVPCVKCKRPIDPETVVCPHCKTNQASRRKDKPDARPIGWDRDPVKHSKSGKLVHHLGLLFFAIVLLGLLAWAGMGFYRFILSQMPDA